MESTDAVQNIEKDGDDLSGDKQDYANLIQSMENLKSEIHDLKRSVESSRNQKKKIKENKKPNIYDKEEFLFLPTFTCQYLFKSKFSAATLRIFFYCLKELELKQGAFNQIYIKNTDIIDELELNELTLHRKITLHRETVSKSLKELENCGLLIKTEKSKVWQINPEAVWKGRANDKKEAVTQLKFKKTDFLKSDFIKEKRKWCEEHNIPCEHLKESELLTHNLSPQP